MPDDKYKVIYDYILYYYYNTAVNIHRQDYNVGPTHIYQYAAHYSLTCTYIP